MYILLIMYMFIYSTSRKSRFHVLVRGGIGDSPSRIAG